MAAEATIVNQGKIPFMQIRNAAAPTYAHLHAQA
jgi:hypothetical protein